VSQRLVLCLGGTRSGKSRFGLRRATELARGDAVTFIVTARLGDPELDLRIEGHRRARPASWPTVDAGDDLAATIDGVPGERTILLDGLTLWLSAVWAGPEQPIDEILDGRLAAALDEIHARPGPVVIVSDEIGLGMVPLEAGMRAFRDLQGIVHQRIADRADEVHLLVAGLPLTLKA
jgi:adenosylcobinamide kinase / adenosylcobinamide-phosphate guanylyltransferase